MPKITMVSSLRSISIRSKFGLFARPNSCVCVLSVCPQECGVCVCARYDARVFLYLCVSAIYISECFAVSHRTECSAVLPGTGWLTVLPRTECFAAFCLR